MTDRRLDEQYFNWLCSQVVDPGVTDPSLTYWKLLKQIFQTRFVWFMEQDADRERDGKALRLEFIRSEGVEGVDPEWINLECSMLELMVGLARHMAFFGDDQPPYWFWHLVENLGLRKYTDDRKLNEARVDSALRRINDRTYNPSGRGGLFPLKRPRQDQREVELWYQMGSYVLEHDEY